MKVGIFLRNELKFLLDRRLNNSRFVFLFASYFYFGFNFLKKLFYFSKNLLFVRSDRYFSFLKYFFHCRNVVGSFLFFFKFFCFRIFKAHGINMRVIFKRIDKISYMFLRVGTSHGFKVRLPGIFSLKIFKKRYFFFGSLDSRLLNIYAYHFRYFRRFFRYKLIGIKYDRDSFSLKVGKKKSF